MSSLLVPLDIYVSTWLKFVELRTGINRGDFRSG